jgi:hypothetical protein
VAKKPFLLRLDEDVLEALHKWAADELRSTNAQIEFIVRQALRESGRAPKRGDPPREDER